MFIELAEAGGHLTLAWEENSFHFMAFNCLFLWKKLCRVLNYLTSGT